VRVLFAGDVAGRRLALVRLILRYRGHTTPTLEWLQGEVDASPGTMRSVNTGITADMTQDCVEDWHGTGYLAVVAPSGSTIRVSLGVTFRADGRLERTWRTAGSDGIALRELPAAPQRILVAVRASRRGQLLSGNGSGPRDWSAQRNTSAAPDGGPSLAPYRAIIDRYLPPGPVDLPWARTMAERLRGALALYGLKLDQVTVTVRFEMTAGSPRYLMTLTPKGGGTLVLANSGGHGFQQGFLELLAPAKGAVDRPYAWRQLDLLLRHATKQVMVSVPSGAVRAEMVVDGTPHPLTVDARGFAGTQVPLTARATVRAYGADGRLLGETPLPDEAGSPFPYTENVGGLWNVGVVPGETRGTRLVD